SLSFAIPAQAKLGETVPQLVKRFGNSYTVEPVQIGVELGERYKFRSKNVSVDAVVANGVSIAETYFSDHPLAADGEPPNDSVRAILKTNASGTRWLETNATPFRADYALQSSDDEYVAFLRYKQPQPENAVWTMTVARRESWAYADANRTSVEEFLGLPPVATPAPTASAATTAVIASGTPHFDPTKPYDTSRAVRPFDPNGSYTVISMPEWNQNWQLVSTPETEEIKAKAEAGDAASQYELGTRYQNGDGVEKNYAEAVKWFRKAAEKNYAPAQRDLGESYYYGLGVERDYAEAVKWYRKAAEQN